MKNNLICKITDKKIYFYTAKNKKIIIENIKSKIIEKNTIVDIFAFIETLEKTIKKHKLNNLITKNKLYILIYDFNTPTDIFLINYAFKTLNYYNFKLITESKIYNELINNNTAIIDIWDNTGEISYLIDNQQINLPYNKDKLKDIPKTKIVIINNTNRELNIRIKNKEIYYLENNGISIIDMFIKIIEKDPSNKLFG